MKQLVNIILIIMMITTSHVSISKIKNNKRDSIYFTGKFDVKLTPQEDEIPAGIMVTNKTYHGDLIDSGLRQMISKRTASGEAVYYAIKEFSGTISGKSGSFTLLHPSAMGKKTQSLNITVLQGSGDGKLKSITGTMTIIQENGNHPYVLEYT